MAEDQTQYELHLNTYGGGRGGGGGGGGGALFLTCFFVLQVPHRFHHQVNTFTVINDIS